MPETIQTQFGTVVLPSTKKQKTEAELRREEHLLRDYASLEECAERPSRFTQYITEVIKELKGPIKQLYPSGHFG